MQTPILGQAYVARSVNAAGNTMVNLFPEAIPEGGQTGGFLNRAPGLRKIATIGTGPIRGLWTRSTGGLDAYIVSGNKFYKIDTDYNATLLGTVSGTGPVSIADSGTQIFIAAGADGYIYTESTDTFVFLCDLYTSIGVAGYGTAGCAQAGTYNLAMSPLPSLTVVPIVENRIIP